MADDNVIEGFFKQQKRAVVATVTGGQPQAALVGISVFDDFRLVFVTNEKTRKFHNIAAGSTVAVVVGLDAKATIQLEGAARVLAGEELTQYEAEHYRQQPWAKTYAELPGQNFIIFEPHWLRYTDIDQKPELIIERNLNAG